MGPPSHERAAARDGHGRAVLGPAIHDGQSLGERLGGGAVRLAPLSGRIGGLGGRTKRLLAGLCFTLTLAAYVRYARRPFSLLRYLAVFVLFALGLMAKPIVVTLPLLLLLLDYWPLGRLSGRVRRRERKKEGESRRGGEGEIPPQAVVRSSPPLPLSPSPSLVRRVIWEKVPLLALAAVGCWVAVRAQGEALAPNGSLPLSWRIGNALVSYGSYLGGFFWPAGLTVLYPHPALCSQPKRPFMAWRRRRSPRAFWPWPSAVPRRSGCGSRCPCLLVGWLWWLGMMLPMIGLVQFGVQSAADRFTYLPQIGLWLALVGMLAVRRIGNPSYAADGALAGTGLKGRPTAYRRSPHAQLGVVCRCGALLGDPRGVRVAASVFLAQHRNLVDARHRLHAAKLRGSYQPRSPRWRSRAGSTKRSAFIVRRWTSARTFRRHTMPWDWPWQPAAVSTKRSPSTKRRSRSPTTP